MRDSSGTMTFKKIQALFRIVAGPSEGTLEVEGGTDPQKLIGPGTYPIRVYTFLPIWARATLGGEPPR